MNVSAEADTDVKMDTDKNTLRAYIPPTIDVTLVEMENGIAANSGFALPVKAGIQVDEIWDNADIKPINLFTGNYRSSLRFMNTSLYRYMVVVLYLLLHYRAGALQIILKRGKVTVKINLLGVAETSDTSISSSRMIPVAYVAEVPYDKILI